MWHHLQERDGLDIIICCSSHPKDIELKCLLASDGAISEAQSDMLTYTILEQRLNVTTSNGRVQFSTFGLIHFNLSKSLSN